MALREPELRRGLFRLWLVATVVWLAFCVFLTITAYLQAQRIREAAIASDWCVPPLPDAFVLDSHPDGNGGTINYVAKSWGSCRTDTPAWRLEGTEFRGEIKQAAAGVILPFVVLLIAHILIRTEAWVRKGFGTPVAETAGVVPSEYRVPQSESPVKIARRQGGESPPDATRRLALVVSALLLAAILPMPHGYYTFLRLAVTVAALWFVYREHHIRGSLGPFAIVFVAIALLFNPILPVDLSKNAWATIDFFVALAFAVWFWMRRKYPHPYS